MTHNTNKTTRRRILRSIATAGSIGVVGIGTTQTATASSNGGIFADGFEADRDLRAFFSGVRLRYSSTGGWPSASLDDYVDRAVNEFRANEAAWIDYGDWLASEHGFSPAGDTVVAVEFEFRRRRAFTDADVVETVVEADFDTDVDRFERVLWNVERADDPDYTVRLVDRAVEQASDELSRFRRKWIGDLNEDDPDHKLPDNAYVNEVAGRYTPDIYLNEDSQHVLELLLGEFDG